MPFLTCDESQNLHEKMVKNYRNLSLIALSVYVLVVLVCTCWLVCVMVCTYCLVCVMVHGVVGLSVPWYVPVGFIVVLCVSWCCCLVCVMMCT